MFHYWGRILPEMIRYEEWETIFHLARLWYSCECAPVCHNERSEKVDVNRRTFIATCGTAISAAAFVAPTVLMEACAPTSIPNMAIPPPPPPGPDGRVPVDVSDLSASNPMKLVPTLTGSDNMPLLVTMVAASDYRALSSKCTHQSCAVNSTLTNGYILCACHLSHFGLDGSVTQGPASTPLYRYDGVYDAANNQLRIKLS